MYVYNIYIYICVCVAKLQWFTNLEIAETLIRHLGMTSS